VLERRHDGLEERVVETPAHVRLRISSGFWQHVGLEAGGSRDT